MISLAFSFPSIFPTEYDAFGKNTSYSAFVFHIKIVCEKIGFSLSFYSCQSIVFILTAYNFILRFLAEIMWSFSILHRLILMDCTGIKRAKIHVAFSAQAEIKAHVYSLCYATSTKSYFFFLCFLVSAFSPRSSRCLCMRTVKNCLLNVGCVLFRVIFLDDLSVFDTVFHFLQQKKDEEIETGYIKPMSSATKQASGITWKCTRFLFFLKHSEHQPDFNA